MRDREGVLVVINNCFLFDFVFLVVLLMKSLRPYETVLFKSFNGLNLKLFFKLLQQIFLR